MCEKNVATSMCVQSSLSLCSQHGYSSMWSGLLFQSNRRLLSGHSNAAWAIATRLSTHASIHPGDKYKFAAARSGKKGGGHFSDFFSRDQCYFLQYASAAAYRRQRSFSSVASLRDPQPKCELTSFSLSLVVTQKADRDCTLPSQQKPVVATAAAVAAATKIKLGKTTSQGPRKVKFLRRLPLIFLLSLPCKSCAAAAINVCALFGDRENAA